MRKPHNGRREPVCVVNNSSATQEGSMRTLLHCLALSCLALVALASAAAQVTITAADVSASLVPGILTTSRTDTATKTIDIGTLGATSWDFSMLKTNITSTSTCVSPDTTPFIGWFPGSTNAVRVGAGGGTLYSYFKLGTDLLRAGSGLTGALQLRTRDVPDDILYKLPMTLGTTWTTTYAESSIVMLPPPLPPQITITNYSVSDTVDAFGNLTLPGGGVYQALRLKTDSRSTTATHSSRTTYYTILARNGATAVVFAADTLQPNSGIINAGSISWTSPLVADVSFSDPVPTEFSLMQNYPNPLNPATVVSYQLPAVTDVRLAVYDLLGREVAMLVNGRKAAGTYEVKFDASGLASGVYLYRLVAGDFIQTRKLVVLK